MGEIFTEEVMTKILNSMYWTCIALMFGVTLAAMGLHPYLMFLVIVTIGFLNPDDILKDTVIGV
jgi:hypothetical protein